MFKNRTAQLIYQTAFCAIGVIAFSASLGLFNARFENNFYVYFTNLSNYICIGVMFAELVQTAKKKADSYVTTLPLLKFMGVLMILLTFAVFNGLLAKDRTLEQNFAVSSVLLHVVLPVLYVGDWFLFYERKKLKWYYPLLSTSIPLIYVAFIFIRAWLMGGEGEVVYPYFFLNLGTLGWSGVLRWIGILLVAFIVVGYLIFAADRFLKSSKERV